MSTNGGAAYRFDKLASGDATARAKKGDYTGASNTIREAHATMYSGKLSPAAGASDAEKGSAYLACAGPHARTITVTFSRANRTSAASDTRYHSNRRTVARGKSVGEFSSFAAVDGVDF
jgi:hypothetical protein